MEYNEIIRKSISGVFSNIYLIDIINDSVIEYDYNYNILNTFTFYNYVEQTKNIINPENVNGFFEAISLKKLDEEKEKNNNQIVYKYKRSINGNYKDYISIIKLISSNNNKYILVLSAEASLEMDKIISDNEEDDKLIQISDRVSDAILKIYNTIDTLNTINDLSQVKHASSYINNLLSNLTRDIPELNNGLEKQIISEVNKNKQALMIIDDDLMTRNLIKKAFAGEYEIIMATNGQEALDILEKNKTKSNMETRDNIVGIFLDLAMPILDGFAVLEYLKINSILNQLPVIIISATEEKATRQRVYKYGIADMIEKPFNLEIIKYRTDNLINLYKTSNSLNELILRKHDDLSEIIKKNINSYLSDNVYALNSIKKVSKMLLTKLIYIYPQYKIMPEQIEKIINASVYYDIGTYFVSRIMSDTSYYEHPLIGSEIINKVLVLDLDKDTLLYASEISKYHHENYDGTGFPNKLSNNDIPIYVQVITLAIEYTKLLLNNNTFNDIYNTIVRQESIKYNPDVIECFKEVAKELTQI